MAFDHSLHGFPPKTLSGNTKLQPQCKQGNPLPQPSCTPGYSWLFWLLLLTPVQLAINPRVCLLGSSPASYPPNCVQNQVQNPALAAVEFTQVVIAQHPVRTLWELHSCSQFSTVGKPTRCTLNSCIWMIYKNIQALGNPTGVCPDVTPFTVTL